MELRGLARMLRHQGNTDALRASGGRLLRSTAGQSRWMLATVALTTVVQVVTAVLTPAVIGSAIDAAIRGGDLGAALGRLVLVVGVTTVAMAVDDLVSSYFGSAVTAALRHRLIGHVLSLGVGGPRRFPAGEVLSRLTENAASPASFFPSLISVLATLMTTVGAVAGLVLIDPRLAITFLVGVPLAALLLRRFVARAGDSLQRYQHLQATIATRLLDAHQGARTIRASGTVERDIDRVVQPLEELHESGRRVWEAQRGMSWQLTLLVPMLQVAVLAVGGSALSTGDITPGELVAASSYVALAAGVVGVLDAAVAMVTCQIGAGRVAEVLDTTPAITTPERSAPLPPGRGHLELRGVCVREDTRLVLDHVDLTIPAGTSVAIVGRSGTGKTALTSLVGRLRDPDEGVVLLDGTDVSEVELPVLRRAVTYAFERPAVLGDTIADMISYGQEQVSPAAVERAAELAQAAQFISLLPDGYDTPLARAPMSGGELQRLSLARAVLRDARLVVLDDATSSLDTATEVKVAEGLRRAWAGRTSLVIAHRTATASRADLVAWLENGRIRALAPHHVLWSEPGYRAVFAAAEDDSGTRTPEPVAIAEIDTAVQQ